MFSFTRAAGGPFGLLKHGCTLMLAGFCLVWAIGESGVPDFTSVWAMVLAVSGWQWGLALGATGLSFAAVAQYDVLFHRWLDTGVSSRRAALSGAASIALAQTLGFGLITGTLSRWRALPELSAPRAFAVTSYVSFSFMIGLGLLCAVLLPATPLLSDSTHGLFASTALVLALVAVICSLLRPAFLPFCLPPLGLMLQLSAWLILDVTCAAIAFTILLPPDLGLTFAPVFTAFVFALCAGLISGAPGGVGAFELCLVGLISGVPAAPLLATVLAFRVVYYALPAALGLLCLVQPRASAYTKPVVSAAKPFRAEMSGLAQQERHRIGMIDGRPFHFVETSQCLVSIGGMADGQALTTANLAAFESTARQRCLTPALYKVRANEAAVARRAGWNVLQLSEEALLTPATFTTDGAARRQLRRKLKSAERAGVRVQAGRDLPLDQMAFVASEWSARAGGERGFSMGMFDRTSIAHQKVMLAWRGAQLVAFATFHHTKEEWCLDLMRSLDTAPSGTMHALIVHAMDEARAAHVAQLSLAAMPLDKPRGLMRLLPNNRGLRQFKMGFAPKTQPLYLAAPSRFSLGLAGLDILLRILRPARLRTRPARAALQKLQSSFSELTVVNSEPDPHLPSQTQPIYTLR